MGRTTKSQQQRIEKKRERKKNKPKGRKIAFPEGKKVEMGGESSPENRMGVGPGLLLYQGDWVIPK